MGNATAGVKDRQMQREPQGQAVSPAAEPGQWGTWLCQGGRELAEEPSQPPMHPAGTKTWAACSREHSNQQGPHDLQPERLLSRFHKASGLHPLNPKIRPVAGNDWPPQPNRH